MPLVIVGLTSGNTRRHGQNRFRPIQRLHLALFIHTQYNGAIRRIQVQAHDISHLFHKLRIFGEFEILYPMWLQSERMPDPHDSVLRQTRLGSHQPSAVCAVFGLRLQRLGYDFFNLMIRDLPWRTYPRLIQQALQSELPKSFPPLPDGRTRNMQLTGDFRVAHFLPTRKHDASTHGHCLSGFWTKSNGPQLDPILLANFQRFLGTSGAHTQVCGPSRTYATDFALRTLECSGVD